MKKRTILRRTILLVATVCTTSLWGQVDPVNNQLLLMRQAENLAALGAVESSAKSEMNDSQTEFDESAKLLEQSMEKFYDCAPGLVQRGKDWAGIEVTLRGAVKKLSESLDPDFKGDYLEELIKLMRKRMFTLPDAKDMPGDVVWRKYKEAFIRAEKAFLGESSLDGIEDLVDFVYDVSSADFGTIRKPANLLSGDVKGIIEVGYLANEKLASAYREEVYRIVEDIKTMHNSWVPSAQKELFYQAKQKELNALYAHLRGSNWIDFIMESEKTDRFIINEEYKKVYDKNGNNH